MHAGWGQWEQRDVSEQEPEPFPCRDDSAILKRGSLWVESSLMLSGPPLPSASLSVASWAHPQHGDTSQASGSSVFRNGRVGATDTHRYPAAYYFLPALAPLQGPAWQVDEVHEKAQQRASFPGMLLLTGFTNQATLHHPRLNGEPTEWRQRVFFFFFFPLSPVWILWLFQLV